MQMPLNADIFQLLIKSNVRHFISHSFDAYFRFMALCRVHIDSSTFIYGYEIKRKLKNEEKTKIRTGNISHRLSKSCVFEWLTNRMGQFLITLLISCIYWSSAARWLNLHHVNDSSSFWTSSERKMGILS